MYHTWGEVIVHFEEDGSTIWKYNLVNSCLIASFVYIYWFILAVNTTESLLCCPECAKFSRNLTHSIMNLVPTLAKKRISYSVCHILKYDTYTHGMITLFPCVLIAGDDILETQPPISCIRDVGSSTICFDHAQDSSPETTRHSLWRWHW